MVFCNKKKLTDNTLKINKLVVNPTGLVNSIYPKAIWNIKTEEKVLYLTFDDGPVPILTEKVLDILDKYDAKASFFCVGENVKKFQPLFNEINDRNHLTGNHTYSHLNGWKTGARKYIKNINWADSIIKSEYFRPPYGKLNFLSYNYISNKFKVIMWDVLSKDFDKRLSPQNCFEIVKRFAKPGSIIVFHDNYKAEKNMLYCLQKTLDFYSESGYKFLRIK